MEIPAIIVGLAAITALILLWRMLLVHEQRYFQIKWLESRNMQLQLINDAVPLLLIYIDRGQVVLYLNSTAEKWFGTSVSSNCSMKLDALVGCDFYATIQAQVKHALTGESSNYGNVPTPAGNDSRHYSMAYIPDVDSLGEVRGLLIVVEDITDQIRSLQELHEADLRMAELKVIRSTAATYAHEINNPLAGIICASQMIAQGEIDDTESRKMALELLAAAKRIAHVTKQLAELENPSYRKYVTGKTEIIEVTKAS
jgi:PAS domain S-box-containing protein